MGRYVKSHRGPAAGRESVERVRSGCARPRDSIKPAYRESRGRSLSVSGGLEGADVRETGLARHRGGQQPRDVVD